MLMVAFPNEESSDERRARLTELFMKAPVLAKQIADAIPKDVYSQAEVQLAIAMLFISLTEEDNDDDSEEKREADRAYRIQTLDVAEAALDQWEKYFRPESE